MALYYVNISHIMLHINTTYLSFFSLFLSSSFSFHIYTIYFIYLIIFIVSFIYAILHMYINHTICLSATYTQALHARTHMNTHTHTYTTYIHIIITLRFFSFVICTVCM